MIIKKHKNKNRYVVANGFYIRDFTQSGIMPIDINSNLSNHTLVENELENFSNKYPMIENEQLYHPKIVIVSDGFNFDQLHTLTAELPKDIVVIAINGALKKWDLECKRAINYYVVNNPFNECMQYLPKHRYYPRCIASIRTNYHFLNEYQGSKYVYFPVYNEQYSGIKVHSGQRIDDYRNPVCAAVGLAYRFGVQKLMFLACDDAFNYEKPSAQLLENGLWQYPQQTLAQELVDANCYWLKTKDIKIGNYSNGINLKNALYINHKDAFLEFFE